MGGRRDTFSGGGIFFLWRGKIFFWRGKTFAGEGKFHGVPPSVRNPACTYIELLGSHAYIHTTLQLLIISDKKTLSRVSKMHLHCIKKIVIVIVAMAYYPVVTIFTYV